MVGDHTGIVGAVCFLFFFIFLPNDKYIWRHLNEVEFGFTTGAFVAQLAARGSHNPKVAGSIPVESICTPR